MANLLAPAGQAGWPTGSPWPAGRTAELEKKINLQMEQLKDDKLALTKHRTELESDLFTEKSRQNEEMLKETRQLHADELKLESEHGSKLSELDREIKKKRTEVQDEALGLVGPLSTSQSKLWFSVVVTPKLCLLWPLNNIVLRGQTAPFLVSCE